MNHFYIIFGCLLNCYLNLVVSEAINPLGLLQTRTLPKSLNGTDWSSLKSLWAEALDNKKIPNTNFVRNYEFVITRSQGSPDGYERSLLLVNDQYPGPLIEANWGDTIQVVVHNNISGPEEGTSIHWHGQPNRLSPWMDGVPSVSQCPIAPGSTFTYEFRAEFFGTGWWHSHFSSQMIDGLNGPMIIYGPQNSSYDIDVGPIMLSDFSHVSYHAFIKDALAAPPTYLPLDNNLINGRNPFNCSKAAANVLCTSQAPRSQFRFRSGQIHRLRLMNVGGTDNQIFSIDGHDLTVIANDYVELVPYKTQQVTLGVGQRTDVLVYGGGKSTDIVWMRSNLDTGVFCGNTTTIQPEALAAIYYEDADTTVEPDTAGQPWVSHNCTNDSLNQTVPLYPKKPAPEPTVTQYFNITGHFNKTGQYLFYVNNSTFRADLSNALLLMAKEGNTSYVKRPEWNVYNFDQNSSVRVIINNFFAGHHPMHLHGHNFYVLAEGIGEWDGKITNSENPQRRDTHIVGPGSPDNPSYVVLQWEQDNPGVWPFHCHITIHNGVGLYVNVMERPRDLAAQTEIPATIAETCQSWNTWTQSHAFDEIDSGT